jgi:hypothetical protein
VRSIYGPIALLSRGAFPLAPTGRKCILLDYVVLFARGERAGFLFFGGGGGGGFFLFFFEFEG